MHLFRDKSNNVYDSIDHLLLIFKFYHCVREITLDWFQATQLQQIPIIIMLLTACNKKSIFLFIIAAIPRAQFQTNFFMNDTCLTLLPRLNSYSLLASQFADVVVHF